MVSKYRFGKPFDTESVVDLPSDSPVFTDKADSFPFGTISIVNSDSEKNSLNNDKSAFLFSYNLLQTDSVFGLGETMGGINKRGKRYQSWCSDDPNHTEEKTSLYGAHNFIIIHSKESQKTFGLYFDYPGLIEWDIGFSKRDELTLKTEYTHLDLYVITPRAGEEKAVLSVIEQFRKIIGQSYIPPFWAFGFMQSRWGYGSEEDLNRVYENYKKHGIPLDAIFLDIDYMEGFKDFTVNKNNFKNFKASIQSLKDKNVHVVPIIDAGIKVDSDSEIDNEGIKNDFFCKKQDGTPFAAGVWPGLSHFTDFLNPKAREWFGSKYKELVDSGVDGFWNDMNEPALFYSEDGIKKSYEKIRTMISDLNPDVYNTWDVKREIIGMQNNMEDYKSFYHRVDEKQAGAFAEKTENGVSLVRHDKVHNLYGYNMTRAASEYFEKNFEKKILMISRASYIGMHRSSGIWTGDNFAWWSHLSLLLHQLPGLNMCGFLYTGCDLGGFGCDTSRDLLLRFMSIGVFTPLMRNHSALGTREQECYQFENPEDFRGIVSLRYRLLPYLFDLFKKCSKEGKMYFKPLCFEYPEDIIAPNIEDQLMVGEDLMIAPVCTQNATGRTVYLPEDMICVTCGQGTGLDKGEPEKTELKKGVHYVDVPLNKIVFFIKKGRKIPVVNVVQTTAELNLSERTWW